MSWDIYVQDIPSSVKSVSEIPDDFKPSSLGNINGPDFSIEVSLGELEDLDHFVFHVRGSDLAAYVVADILRHLGLRAFDPNSRSGIFELEGDPAAGLRGWQEYRDHIVGNNT